MNTLREFLKEKINNTEMMLDYSIATDTLRDWIKEWEEAMQMTRERRAVEQLRARPRTVYFHGIDPVVNYESSVQHLVYTHGTWTPSDNF